MLIPKSIRKPAALLVLSFGLGLMAASAQEATPPAGAPAGTVICDANLMLQLYVAERFFGFSGVMNKMTAADPSALVNASAYDKGQYSPLFNSSMAALPGTTLTDEQMQGMANVMQLDNAAMQTELTHMMPAGTDLTSFTALNTLSIAGEDPSCTSLRTQLNNFYTVLAYQDLQANGTANPSTGIDATTSPSSSIGGSNSTGSSISGNGGATTDNMPGTAAQVTPPAGGTSPGG